MISAIIANRPPTQSWKDYLTEHRVIFVAVLIVGTLLFIYQSFYILDRFYALQVNEEVSSKRNLTVLPRKQAYVYAYSFILLFFYYFILLLPRKQAYILLILLLRIKGTSIFGMRKFSNTKITNIYLSSYPDKRAYLLPIFLPRQKSISTYPPTQQNNKYLPILLPRQKSTYSHITSNVC